MSFSLLDNEQIGMDFSNDLTYSQDFNVYKYRNYYNGGGVAIGDINNDGFVDIYFTANQKPNQLYLNKGDFTFENITARAGVSGNKAWSTGVTMIDINQDGWLDIYVCNSGDVAGDNKENELFINNGDLTFTESAESYGLNDKGFSTHASFFDYDKDGDLDVYILNNSYQAIGSFNLRKNERPVRDLLGGDKLMQNQDGHFVDVSEAAGIYGSVIGFGLGITVGDVNNDGWEDIYVSNDFFERDYLYINQKNGTFVEKLTDEMSSISAASMGADMADINNDGQMDIFVTEMLPSDDQRLKTVTTFDDWNRFQYNLTNGYHRQYTRNMLQVNNGNETFSELGRFSGVEASDWSWGALFFDMDNDGFKDLFIANGIYQDLTNQDYLQYVANEQVVKSIVEESGVNYQKLIDIIPSHKVANHFYRNKGNAQFDKLEEEALIIPTFSNGSAYGDLDNDGDLDLVINNVNMPSMVYRNNSEKNGNDYIKIQLTGESPNIQAIGSKVTITTPDGGKMYYEVQPARGFQSSMDIRINAGVGLASLVEIDVIWPDGTESLLKDVPANQLITIDKNGAKIGRASDDMNVSPLFHRLDSYVNFAHKENAYNDFNRERLIYQMRSSEGPVLGIGDMNEDGYDDIIVPGAKDSKSELLFGSNKGFTAKDNFIFPTTSEWENTKCLVFDANGDGHLDVYLASGSVELTPFSEYLYDQLYLGDGKGQFQPTAQRFPNDADKISTGAIAFADIDQDGDQDLFVGERVRIGKFGEPSNGYLLLNDGTGNFTDQTSALAPQLKNIGMITDASFSDLDGDGDQDLIVVGEFMSIEIFENIGGQFVQLKYSLHDELKGWWNKVHVIDIDGDGDQDIIAGNLGLNSRFKASLAHPIKMYFNDFDLNGFPEGILTYRKDDGKDYPYALRHNLIDQLKYLKKKFPDFESYKNADITQVFSAEQLSDAVIWEANHMATTLLINDGGMNFSEGVLPQEVQYSPIYAITTADFDHDGDQDIVLGGNLSRVLPEAGGYDATQGIYLQNEGNQQFKFVPNGRGFFEKGEIRDLRIIDKDKLIVALNNDSLYTYRFGLD
jgi:enediyne biosynthesis protein E4